MLKKIRALTEQYAIPATFIAYILIDLLLLGLGRLLSLMPPTLPMAYLNEVILILVPVAIVFFFGFSRAFKNGNFFRGLYCCLPFLLLQLTILLIFFSYVFLAVLLIGIHILGIVALNRGGKKE